MTARSKSLLGASTIAALLAGCAPSSAPPDPPAERAVILDWNTRFYVPKPLQDARLQIAELTAAGDRDDAAFIGKMIDTPQAVWLTGGDPHGLRQQVTAIVQRAEGKGTVPVLVAYNLPFRDCAQYSAGGAQSVFDYVSWIAGLVEGIGDHPAVVILEPDGLGIIPWHVPFGGDSYEWCQPAEADPMAAAQDRFDLLNFAVDALKSKPGISVYLDGTHSAWLAAGDAAARLVNAGVLRADGFFLNVSNFQSDERLIKYGTWISSCIAFANNPEEGGWRLGHYDWCASQYYPAYPNDFSTWHLTDEWYAGNLGSAVPSVRFVIDSSRNGQGPWVPDPVPGDPQDWCNPPDRGLGVPPTAYTGVPLLDAYLWVKIPGTSDGQCWRWTGGPLDPVRGMEDPAAGEWFPEMALELVRFANPGLQ